MNYDETDAGREMDALVAEKVMGITWDTTRCRWCGWPLREKVEDGCVPGNCSLRPLPDPPMADIIAPYSTSISAAWEVAEKMKELFPGYTVEVGWYHEEEANPATPGGWTAMIEGDDRIIYNRPAAPTAPLAICRAALTAVEK